jgi:two-component system, OmpR family, sensor histidine kinase KdpD
VGRGQLRILFGAVAGVGKTYAMLHEGWLRKQRGIDVVVGYVETHGRAETAEQIRDLEIVPRRVLQHRGATFEEMDVDAVLARAPEVCLVDELAHTNVPGSRNPKRWQDVDELLDAGIDVLTTLNIQHLESLNDVIERITGVRQRETIPDEFVRAADEIQLVELTPEALRRRLEHGDIYPPERIDAALTNFFRPGNLGALRELALMWLADRVDRDLHEYMVAHGIGEPWETRERVLVAVTGAPGADRVIRRASRLAARVKGDLIGVHVRTQDGLRTPDPVYLDEDRTLVEELGGHYREVAGDDIAGALLAVAQAEQATQVVLGSSRRSRWQELTRGSIIRDVVRAAGAIDVHVISHGPDVPATRLPRRPRFVGVSPRRRRVGYVAGLGGLAALTLTLRALPGQVELSSILLSYLAVIVTATAIGGRGPALVTTIGGFVVADFFFTEPFHTFVVDDPEVLVALAVFAIVATVVSWLADSAARRRSEADRATAEARTLARLTTTLLETEDPLPQLVTDLVAAFGLDAAALLRQHGGEWQIEAAAGDPVPRTPEDGTDVIELPTSHALVLVGGQTPADDRRVLAAFAAQLAVALAAQQLREHATEAEQEARANELRASLLSAVSHDLRTPLSTIKASASSLLADDVTWNAQAVQEFAHAIVDEADRLNTLVGNLLDMSRLQANAVTLQLRPTALDEVVPNALKGLDPSAASRVTFDVPDHLPAVAGDPVLIERIVANLVDNALRWSPPDQTIHIRADADGEHVQLRVIDHGPGIPADVRDQVLQPFQRHGDSQPGHGVGLGLAVAHGFAQAMHGELAIHTTPGGGATVTLTLPIAP